MPDSYLRNLLSTRGDIVPRPDALIERCGAAQRAGETLVAVLSRLGVFKPSAPRALELMKKGFLSPELGILLAPDAAERIATVLSEAADSAGPATTSAGPTDRVPVTSLTRNLPRTETVPELTADSPTSGMSPRPPSPPATGAPPVGTTLGRCLLTAVLGKGGHGVVYTALHQSLNIPVAVKVLVSAHGPDPNVRTKLRHEARALARLNHPNIIRVLDFDDGELPYVVMEYVEGPSLADLISQTGGVRVERARDIFTQACRGLEAAWAEGIVHRDIKPANILLTRAGVVKLADLGLALTTGPDAYPATSGSPVGTCAYMAPEQARTADTVDFTADIYSLGVTMYHSVTGQHPFPARNAREALLKHATEPLVPPHVLAPNLVDEATSAVVVRMMAKKPEDRYQSYAELIAALAAAGPVEPPASGPRTSADVQPPTTPSKQSRRRGWFRSKKDT